ncbi:MAG: hypothetical protein WAJ85_03795 [Candidatus Baltobacteraceae bacterium]|jgi:ADP-heptose:LPS heptosyltransferase
MRCTAFCTNGIGDHLLLLPALRALVSMFPGQVTIVSPPGYSAILFGDLEFARAIPVETWWEPQVRHFDADAVAGAIDPGDLFVCFDRALSDSHRRLLDVLAPADSLGFFSEFKRAVRFRHDRHAADQAFALATALDPRLTIEEFAGAPWIDPLIRPLLDGLRERLSTRYKLLVAHTDTASEKMWEPRRFGRFFDAFLSEREDFVVAVVGHRVGAQALGRPQPRKFDFTAMPLGVSLGLAQRADLFVGIDSCALHAADLARVPSVALLGPASNPVEWGLRFTARGAVRRAAPLSELDADSVLSACRDVLT